MPSFYYLNLLLKYAHCEKYFSLMINYIVNNVRCMHGIIKRDRGVDTSNVILQQT